ncbi:ubiquitin-protein ligase E3 [Schizosaccharomyces cryophilus OY26]|uniref:Ubiquitin-protein ligase E3 n=1 Tax=Schizosaccharomyces cryophilus (strain OY26 / ATCC MYA-4695 / CBS 11777 / NBRC 106824 / NRRL Y48691) TaxID=653667 RepID=S9W2N9_SCHCR|nr:ubiquitin-protein ligase E3 [Schizosaccharomyces cryophilus OY26]EPY52754.1 ubiquitin-protein ligase E3 [Schizosaccharomyces cryophilus OY26]
MHYYIKIVCENPVQDIFSLKNENKSKKNTRWPPKEHAGFRLEEISIISMDHQQTHVPRVEEVSLGHGIIHLYKEIPDMTSEFRAPGLLLAILAIPLYMSPSDILGFLGEKSCRSISHIRLLRTKVQNRILALLKFVDQVSVIRFFSEYNGKAFSQIEPETCHVVHVDEIQVESPSDSPTPLMNITSRASTFSRPLAPPTPSLVELPTCVVCLERMDSSVTGLITIACQHTFHCQCLQKWGNSSCPVCRYTQKDQALRHSGKCFACSCEEDLWMCLICGNIGCGRYHDAHAKQHFIETNHCYAMNLESQRVWDYAGDSYVHRLLQSELDGKVVELSNDSKPAGESSAFDQSNLKIREKMGLEYTQILTSQLESQRIFYESQLSSMAEKLTRSNEEITLKSKITTASSNANNELRSRVDVAEGNLKKKDNKIKKLSSEIIQWRHDYDEEKSMNENLLMRIQSLEARHNKKVEEIVSMQQQISDLSDQLRDLMFTISASQELQKFNDSEDVKNATVVVPNAAIASSSSTKAKKKKKKKLVPAASSSS